MDVPMTDGERLSKALAEAAHRVTARERQCLGAAVLVLEAFPTRALHDRPLAQHALSTLATAGSPDEQLAEAATAFFVALGIPAQTEGCAIHGLQCPAGA
ncbi:MAG: hypothetical protein GQE15_35870 [Archangiaceae bacterium]|nr:hypothetical protein [Archangiaceae bacterium]